MIALYLGLVLLAAVGLGAGLFKLYQFIQNLYLGSPGYVQKTFMTPNEVDFYRRLCAAASPDWVVFPQVSMGALMNTRLKPTHSRYWAERSTFQAKICDFVICHPKTLAPQVVVELDDVMHNFDKDRARDTLAAKAGYRTVRFWSRKKPSVAELKHELDRVLALNKR